MAMSGVEFIAAGRGQGGPELEANSDLPNLERRLSLDGLHHQTGTSAVTLKYPLIHLKCLPWTCIGIHDFWA